MLNLNSWLESSDYGLSGGNGGFLVATGSQVEDVIAPVGYMRLGHGQYVLSYTTYDYTLGYLSRPDTNGAFLWLPEPSEISVRASGSGEFRLTQNGAVRLSKNREADISYTLTWDLLDEDGAGFFEGLGSSPAPLLLSPDPFGMALHTAAEDVMVDSVKGASKNGKALYRVRASLVVMKVYWPGLIPTWNQPGTHSTDGLLVSTQGVYDAGWVNGSVDATGSVSYPQLATLACIGLDDVPDLSLYSSGSLPFAKVYRQGNQVVLEHNGTHVLGPYLGQMSVNAVAIGYNIATQTLTAGYAAVHPLGNIVEIKTLNLPQTFRVPNRITVSGTSFRLPLNRAAWPYPLTQGFLSRLLSLTLEETQSWRVAEV